MIYSRSNRNTSQSRRRRKAEREWIKSMICMRERERLKELDKLKKIWMDGKNK